MSDETMLNNEEHAKAAREEHAWARVAGWIGAGVCLVYIGWLAHGLMPKAKEGPDAGKAMMEMIMKKPKMVTLAVVSNEVVNPPYMYIGHVEPIQDVSLRAQIEGYVNGVHFKEGALVKAGDLLFTIEPEQYEARVSVRKAEVQQAQAALERAESYLKRLEAADPRAVTQMDVDTARSDVAQGRAGVEQAKANLVLAEIDLKHTRITAPIDGRVGRTAANVGDYVSPSIGTLIRIVQMDPMRVAFSVTDRDYVKMRENIEDAKVKETLRIRLKLPTGTVADMVGERDFENNVMSQGTASISVLVRFPNTQGLLVPDGYVTVMVDLANPEPEPVVSQKALKMDPNGTFVYVVDEQYVATRRDVVTGTEENGRVAIVSGLKAGDRIVEEGLQNVMPGMPVTPAEAPAAAREAEPVK